MPTSPEMRRVPAEEPAPAPQPGEIAISREDIEKQPLGGRKLSETDVLENKLRHLKMAGNLGKEQVAKTLKSLGFNFDEQKQDIEQAYETALNRVETQIKLRQEIVNQYLSEEERKEIERGELQTYPDEELETSFWVIMADAEEALSEPDYFKQYFGQWPEAQKVSAEEKPQFIERTVNNERDRLNYLRLRMRALGLTRDKNGQLRLRAPDQPQEPGEIVSEVMAHALMIGLEKAHSKQDEKGMEAVADAVYSYLGQSRELKVEVGDIIEEALVSRVAPVIPETLTAAQAKEIAELARAGLKTVKPATEWGAKGPSIETVLRQTAEAQPPQAAAAPEPEITFERPEFESAEPKMEEPVRLEEKKREIAAQAPLTKETPEKKLAATERAPKPSVEQAPVIPADAVAAAQEAYQGAEESEPVKNRWKWVGRCMNAVWENLKTEARHLGRSVRSLDWWKERGKGLATAGGLEFYHFFKYGRAARQEAKAIEQAYNLMEDEIGIGSAALETRIKEIIDDAELRMMKRLRDYTGEFGESVVASGSELDRFRKELGERLREIHEQKRGADRRELRDLILKNLDPNWYRRGRWGLIELGLVGQGVALAVNKWIAQPMELPKAMPGPKGEVIVRGEVVAGPPEITLPAPEVSPMTKTVWHTLKELYPNATNQQLVDASKEVLKMNQMYDSSSEWYDVLKFLEDGMRLGKIAAEQVLDAARLPEGFPIKGILSGAVKKIMGMAAGGGLAV